MDRRFMEDSMNNVCECMQRASDIVYGALGSGRDPASGIVRSNRKESARELTRINMEKARARKEKRHG